VLVEFALVALAFYLILAAILTFGVMLFQANMIQQAVDVGAQEIARMPLPINATLGLSLQSPTNLDTTVTPASQNPTFLAQIYDEKWLYVDVAQQLNGPSFYDFAAQNFPLINRLLAPAMIFDPTMGQGQGVFRYPGAVVKNIRTNNFTVLVPLVNSQASTITWAMPVEEVLIPYQGNYYSAFNAIPPANSPPNFVPGMVALRINFPSQSASMNAPAAGNGLTNFDPILADDSTLTESNSLSNYSLVVEENAGFDQDGVQVYGGKYGLGRNLAYAQQLGVRPYHKVISAQAIYRREAFQ